MKRGRKLDKVTLGKAIQRIFGEDVQVHDLQEIKNWSESRVIKVKATLEGSPRSYYAKWSRSGVGHNCEEAISRLSTSEMVFPAVAGGTFSLDGQDWLVQRDVEGFQLAARSDSASYKVAVEQLALFHDTGAQRGWYKRILGIPTMHTQVEELRHSAFDKVRDAIARECFTGVNLAHLLTTEEQLNKNWSTLSSLLHRFPQTLVHGDCHSGNLFLTDDGICLIDWSSPMVAPGMLDLVGLLDVAERMGDNIGDRAELLDHYVQALSPEARAQYVDRDMAFRALRICRALLELGWFAQTQDDYGERVNRELSIINMEVF